MGAASGDQPLRRLHHVCIVVEDLDAAVTAWQAAGVGPWTPFSPDVEYVSLEVDDEDAFRRLRYVRAPIGDVELQLCQPPPDDCPQRRHLERHGPGVFHLGFEVDDAAALPDLAERGLQSTAVGIRADGTGFAYLATQGLLGATVSVRGPLAPHAT